MEADHIVLWVAEPLKALRFYEEIVGLSGLRVQEFRDETAPFLSVRVSNTFIIDLMAHDNAGEADKTLGTGGSAGNAMNHVCLTMSQTEFRSLYRRVLKHGLAASSLKSGLFGARGAAPEAFYFADPDGNVIEARYYA